MLLRNLIHRKRLAKRWDLLSGRGIEVLETRVVPATGTITTSFSSGTLTISGSGAADTVDLNFDGNTANTVTLSNTNLAMGSSNGPYTITGAIIISMGAGGDTVTLRSTTSVATYSAGSMSVDLGDGDDTLTTDNVANFGLILTKHLTVTGGGGGDTVQLGGSLAANTFVVANTSINNSDTGTGVNESVTLDRFTGNGTVTIRNAGTGTNSVTFGTDNARKSSATGNVSITQENGATVAYTVSMTDPVIGGNLYISNGNGTAATTANVTITDTVAPPVAGNAAGQLTYITNGNNPSGANLTNLSNTIEIRGGADSRALFANSVTLTNGNTTGANNFNIVQFNGATVGSSTTNPGRTTLTIANGASTNNDINLGINTNPALSFANTFNAQVFANNNSNNATATNDISVQLATVGTSGVGPGRNLQLTNGLLATNATTSTTTNTVNVATIGAVTVNNGNLVITNANTGAAANTINIGSGAIGLTTTSTQASGLGNVTISNGTSIQAAAGANTFVIAGDANNRNTIAGSLSVINRGASGAGGTKVITLNGVTVNGRTGATLNNAGVGDSTTNIGVGAPGVVFGSTAASTAGLFVQDGSGVSTLNIETATIGFNGTANQAGLRYQDLGGGADTINLANAAGTLVVNGVTRLETNAGTDNIKVARLGSATFNDSIFINLGAGNDDLQFGSGSAGTALSTADKFQFDGNAGTDAFHAFNLGAPGSVIASYTTNNNGLPKRLRSKITNFETINDVIS